MIISAKKKGGMRTRRPFSSNDSDCNLMNRCESILFKEGKKFSNYRTLRRRSSSAQNEGKTTTNF